jgi:hypothetical protein
MEWKEELAEARVRWQSLTVYQKFEHVVILILTLLIAVVIVFAVWSLALKVLLSLILLHTFDLTDHAVFQAVFGMILMQQSHQELYLPGSRVCCGRHSERSSRYISEGDSGPKAPMRRLGRRLPCATLEGADILLIRA